MVFQTQTDCRQCTLGAQCLHPGLPTRLLSQVPGASIAMLFIGEAPGFHEDQAGQSWVGKAGQLLTAFIANSDFPGVDVYLSNACRCRPPQNKSPKVGQVSSCRSFLQCDLDLLGKQYPTLYLVCCGRWGLEAVLKASRLASGFNQQGRTLSDLMAATKKKWRGLTPPEGCTVHVFTTYHPANLIPGRHLHDKDSRTPSLVLAVQEHFRLISQHIRGIRPLSYEDLPIDVHLNKPFPQMEDPPQVVDLDIETYGILSTREQTVFEPHRMEIIDGVPPGRQVVCLTLGFETAGRWQAYFYHWAPGVLPLIEDAFAYISSRHLILRGQNIKFDVGVLRAQGVAFRYWLNPLRIRLDDTLLLSFLTFEGWPERGLKELTKLFGIYDYAQHRVTGARGRAQSPSDPALISYNVVDTYNVHQLATYLARRMEEMYGEWAALKFSPLCLEMRNAILWDTLFLQEAGVAFSIPKLEALDTSLTRRADLLAVHLARCGLLCCGKGSQNSIRALYHRAFEVAGALNDPRVVFTEEERHISTGKENTKLLMSILPPDTREYALVAAFTKYVHLSKLVSSYTKTLLEEPRRGILRRRDECGIAFPYWFPMPSRFAKDDAGGREGGTKQARFAAQQPAEQTLPPEVKKCLCSRFPGGTIRRYDESQCELRVLAIWTGDPTMVQEYREGIDRHTQLALETFPLITEDHPQFKKLYRQAAKSGNFLVVYRGGATTLQATVLRMTGVELDLSLCQQILTHHDQKYPVVRAAQDRDLEFVKNHGFLIVPTGWSRYWGKGTSVYGKVSEIADFPIQTLAAQLVQWGEFEIHCEFLSRRLKSVIFDQVHDSLGVDIYPGEEEITDEIITKHLTHPGLLGRLLESIGPDRAVPLFAERE